MAGKETLEQELSSWIRGVFSTAFAGAEVGQVSPSVVPTADESFGDYQCNACLALAKQLKQPPRAVAQAVVNAAGLLPSIQKIDIAGPGFLNLTLKADWLAERLASHAPMESPRRVFYTNSGTESIEGSTALGIHLGGMLIRSLR